jgi:hypothetical protein
VKWDGVRMVCGVMVRWSRILMVSLVLTKEACCRRCSGSVLFVRAAGTTKRRAQLNDEQRAQGRVAGVRIGVASVTMTQVDV